MFGSARPILGRGVDPELPGDLLQVLPDRRDAEEPERGRSDRSGGRVPDVVHRALHVGPTRVAAPARARCTYWAGSALFPALPATPGRARSAATGDLRASFFAAMATQRRTGAAAASSACNDFRDSMCSTRWRPNAARTGPRRPAAARSDAGDSARQPRGAAGVRGRGAAGASSRRRAAPSLSRTSSTTPGGTALRTRTSSRIPRTTRPTAPSSSSHSRTTTTTTTSTRPWSRKTRSPELEDRARTWAGAPRLPRW